MTKRKASKPASERVREYRKRHGRIDVITTYGETILKRLVRHKGKTKRLVLEEILSEAEKNVVSGMSKEQEAEYFKSFD